jgi:hypothetical protein
MSKRDRSWYEEQQWLQLWQIVDGYLDMRMPLILNVSDESLNHEAFFEAARYANNIPVSESLARDWNNLAKDRILKEQVAKEYKGLASLKNLQVGFLPREYKVMPNQLFCVTLEPDEPPILYLGSYAPIPLVTWHLKHHRQVFSPICPISDPNLLIFISITSKGCVKGCTRPIYTVIKQGKDVQRGPIRHAPPGKHVAQQGIWLWEPQQRMLVNIWNNILQGFQIEFTEGVNRQWTVRISQSFTTPIQNIPKSRSVSSICHASILYVLRSPNLYDYYETNTLTFSTIDLAASNFGKLLGNHIVNVPSQPLNHTSLISIVPQQNEPGILIHIGEPGVDLSIMKKAS